MLFLKQSTATTVRIGPVVSVDDGYTLRTSLTVGDATCNLVKGVTSSTLTLTASGGNNDFVHIANGHWSLELTASNTDTLGRLSVTLRDDDVFLPTWGDFTVLAANIYDSLVGGGGVLKADVTQVGGTAIATAASGYFPADLRAIAGDTTDATDFGAAIDNTNNVVLSNVQYVSDDASAATNMEAMFDGTGYAGGTARLQVDIQQVNGQDTVAAMLDTQLKAAGNNQEAGATFVVDTGSFSPTTTAFEVSSTHGDATNDTYNGRQVVWRHGSTNFGVRTEVTDYDGTNKRFTVNTMPAAPSSLDEFFII